MEFCAEERVSVGSAIVFFLNVYLFLSGVDQQGHFVSWKVPLLRWSNANYFPLDFVIGKGIAFCITESCATSTLFIT